MNLNLNPYACSVCDEAFSNSKLLLNHVQTEHKPITPLNKIGNGIQNSHEPSSTIKSETKIISSTNSQKNFANKHLKEYSSEFKENVGNKNQDSSNISKIRKNCENVTKSNKIAGQLGSVAGSVIQVTGRSEIEDESRT